jgi:hypothetical protein
MSLKISVKDCVVFRNRSHQVTIYNTTPFTHMAQLVANGRALVFRQLFPHHAMITKTSWTESGPVNALNTHALFKMRV